MNLKKYKWEIKLAAVLLSISFIIYFALYMLLDTSREILNSLFQQLAFLPIYIFLVTLIIEQVLNKKEKMDKILKLNVIINAFFNEMGRELLHKLTFFDTNIANVKEEMIFTDEFFDNEWKQCTKDLKSYTPKIDINLSSLSELKDLLYDKKAFLLQLVQNPNLFEHESFTELLMAISHLHGELSVRSDIKNLSKADMEHLSADIGRVYKNIIYEWIYYMKHLKIEYPYLFSLELRTNPFKD